MTEEVPIGKRVTLSIQHKDWEPTDILFFISRDQRTKQLRIWNKNKNRMEYFTD